MYYHAALDENSVRILNTGNDTESYGIVHTIGAACLWRIEAMNGDAAANSIHSVRLTD